MEEMWSVIYMTLGLNQLLD